MYSHAWLLSCVRLLATLWSVAHEAPPSMGFSRKEYWRGLPFPSLGDFPDLGVNPTSPVSSALAGGFFTNEPLGKSCYTRGCGLLQWKKTMQDQKGKMYTGQSLKKWGTNFSFLPDESHRIHLSLPTRRCSLVWFISPPFWPFKKFNYFYDSPLFPFRFVATVFVLS